MSANGSLIDWFKLFRKTPPTIPQLPENNFGGWMYKDHSDQIFYQGVNIGLISDRIHNRAIQHFEKIGHGSVPTTINHEEDLFSSRTPGLFIHRLVLVDKKLRRFVCIFKCVVSVCNNKIIIKSHKLHRMCVLDDASSNHKYLSLLKMEYDLMPGFFSI
jgi:hypothetical protein